MSAPKSDTATIESRKNRLLELLAEGKTQGEAAEVLRVEGYPADLRTVRRDVRSLRGQWGEQNMTQLEQWRDDHIQELAELREKLESPDIKPDVKIALALQIIREDSRLKGTAAPAKSIVGHVNGPQLDALYLEIREVLLDADEPTRQEVLDHARQLVKSRRKPIVVDLNLFPKELTDGNV
jgi:hypothetical protein